MFKKFLFIALIFGIVFAGCDKKAKEKDGEGTKTEQTENKAQEVGNNQQQQKTREQQQEEQFGDIQLTPEKVSNTVEKLPAWVEATSKYSAELSQIQDLGMEDGESFVDKIPGLKKDLEAAGINPDEYFPVLEKVLQGHMFLRSKEMYAQQKTQYEEQRKQIQDKVDDPEIPEEEKAQYKTMLVDFDRQIKMFEEGPPGFTEKEIDMIAKEAGKIDQILQQMQQQQQQQQQQQRPPQGAAPQGGQPQGAAPQGGQPQRGAPPQGN
ncbi:MAG: hypothetical protein ACLFSQ_02200 [Candidatus Zixiibacteriota bacterium]